MSEPYRWTETATSGLALCLTRVGPLPRPAGVGQTAAMAYRRYLTWLVAVLGVLWGLLANRFQAEAGRSWTYMVSDFVTGVTLLVCGALIDRWRPRHRSGVLLLAAGFAWFVGTAVRADLEFVRRVAFSFDRWGEVFVVWAALAFPSGRLVTRSTRVVFAMFVTLQALRSACRLLLYVEPDTAGYGTRNAISGITDPEWFLRSDGITGWALVLALLLVAIELRLRWRAASRLERRVVQVVMWAVASLALARGLEQRAGWRSTLPFTDVAVFHVRYWATAAVAVALTVGLARVRFVRSAVVELVGQLPNDQLGVQGWTAALRDALDDPTVRILPWVPEDGRFAVDDDLVVDAEVARGAATLVERHGAPLVVLLHDPVLALDPPLLEAVAATLQVATVNEQLRAELQAQLTELEASRARILSAGDQERRRIERDLHDGAQQRLVAIGVALRLTEARLDDVEGTKAALQQAVEDLAAAVEELRSLARGIHPTVLTESGLGAALESLTDRSVVPVHLSLRLDRELPENVAVAAYFAASEALTNVAKHAGATQAWLSAQMRDEQLMLEIRDDGRGGITTWGSGLRGIVDRVAAAGGDVRVTCPPGSGARVEVRLPCAS